MTTARTYGCEKCRHEWGHWSSHHTYVELVDASEVTGLRLYRCNACTCWWRFHVLDDRPRCLSTEEANETRMDIAEVTRADVAAAFRPETIAEHNFFAREAPQLYEVGITGQAPKLTVYRIDERGSTVFESSFTSERAALEAFTRELRGEISRRPWLRNTRPR
ncbi:MAG: hypothetical protein HGA51_05955 [Demequinaceae bacterium]|nr:hypothetical protein [Demequinaceae bacterium]